MTLSRRLRQLEIKIKLDTRQFGCDVKVFIVVPEEMQQSRYDSSAYRPTDGEIEEYLKHLKESGQCRDCKGSCAVDWSPSGFINHSLLGERSSSSPTPKISLMFCATADTPDLTRRIMLGERTKMASL